MFSEIAARCEIASRLSTEEKFDEEMPHAKVAKDAKEERVAAWLENAMATKNTENTKKERGILCVLCVLCGYSRNNFFASFAPLA